MFLKRLTQIITINGFWLYTNVWQKLILWYFFNFNIFNKKSKKQTPKV